MATPNKRRAASPRERAPRPKHDSSGTTKGVQTPGEPTAHQRYGTYRTLKILQIMMQATEKFLEKFSPFLPDEAGRQAANLHAEITTNMPIVVAHIARMERSPNAENAGTAAKAVRHDRR